MLQYSETKRYFRRAIKNIIVKAEESISEAQPPEITGIDTESNLFSKAR